MEIPSGPEGVKKINWRQFGRHWIVVFILAILAAFVIWGMLNVSPWLKKLQDWRAARALQSEIEKLYRNDKYGGKTPEETFDMFIAALEKGDIELASKYFVIEKQESWKQSLTAIKSQPAVYDEMLTEMRFARSNAHQKTEGNFAWFSYTMPGEKLGEQLVFEKILNRWKIGVL
jgi:hypothetical protein